MPSMADKQPRPKLAENIQAARVAAGMTQEVAADRIGIRQGYLSALERGERTPSMDMLKRVAVALETTPSKLLEDT